VIYEEIVIGSSLRAVMFAFIHSIPLVFTEAERPFRFDYLPEDLDLSCIGIENTKIEVKTHGVPLIFGSQKAILWEKMIFIMSMRGLVPLSDLCSSMRHRENKIICSNEYSKIAEIQFDKCYFFGDAGITHILEQKKVADDKIVCYDYIAFNRGGKHDIDYIETEDDFVKQIWFYPTDRIDGNSSVKDVCAVSVMSREDPSIFDFSETMARFKVVNEMENRGMRGLFNGYCPKYGSPKYYKFRTSYITRILRNKNEKIWIETENIKSPRITEEALYPLLSEACLAYDILLER